MVDAVAFSIRLSVRPQSSSRWYQSALLRARRETSMPRVIATRARAVSGHASESEPYSVEAPDKPRSSSHPN